MVFGENEKKLTNIRKQSHPLHSLFPTGGKIYSVFGKPSGGPEITKSLLHPLDQAKVVGKRCSNPSVNEHTKAESLLELVLESQGYRFFLLNLIFSVSWSDR